MPSVQRLPSHVRAFAPGRLTGATATATGTALLLALTLCGCSGGGRLVAVPAPGAVRIPTFVTVPDDLARSPQLRALVPRDTAGLDPTDAPARGDLLPAALAAFAALDDAPQHISDLTIYSDFVNITYEQGGVAGRAVTASYRPDADVYVGDPSFSDDPTFDLATIDPSVPAALIDAIHTHVPNAQVSRLDLDAGLSSGFGVVWVAYVEDARGALATVYADLDGAIVAVDMD
jgi:hypothetical protein